MTGSRPSIRKHWRNTFLLVGVVLLVTTQGGAAAATLPDRFPRLANVYYNPAITVEQAEKLARWDMVVLSMDQQFLHPEIFSILRKKNPDIILLAYAASEEIPLALFDVAEPDNPHAQLVRGVDDGWWLTDAAGNRMGNWPGTHLMNVTNKAPFVNGKRWNTYLPEFMHDTVMSTGLWDGLYYDNVWPDISWFNKGDIDADRDGIADVAAQLDRDWQEGMATMLTRSRQLEGKNAVIIGGGGGNYYTALNGRLIESFPSPYDGGWDGAMQKYFDVMQRGYVPSVVIVNSSSTTGGQDDYQSMRFALTSTLLNDGFLSFDYGIERHADLWWYDEYDAYLGKPLGAAKNVRNASVTKPVAGIWRRDFTDGIVLVNATDASAKIDLLDGYEKITGAQATSVNTGTIVRETTLGSRDGLVLLKRTFTVEQGGYLNGAFARIFTPKGTTHRQGFFTYDEDFAGGLPILKYDLSGNGTIETVFSREGTVYILNSEGVLQTSFAPFGTQYRDTVELAVGDLDGNGTGEIVTGTSSGNAALVRMYTRNGTLVHPGFRPFPKRLKIGTHVAVGDLDGDGTGEIVVGAGQGGGPQVMLYDRAGRRTGSFFAYHKRFRGGVSVAAGDLDQDGKAEIITGPGRGGGPHVRIFTRFGKDAAPGFFAFAKNFRGGILVQASDFNRDHINEILVSSPGIY